MKDNRLKIEIARCPLGDLERGACLHAEHAKAKIPYLHIRFSTDREQQAHKTLRSDERVGFEPKVAQIPQRFSRPSHSSTLAPLWFSSIVPRNIACSYPHAQGHQALSRNSSKVASSALLEATLI